MHDLYIVYSRSSYISISLPAVIGLMCVYHYLCPMIDHATIAQILDAADVLDVVQDFVSLKKRGVNHVGLCPFHNEKTASFTVSQAKGIFKCFGCGKGGNAVNFVMEHEHLSYYEALKYLAKKYNIEVVEKEMTAEDIQLKNERESLLIISSYAQKYFSDTLQNNMEGIAVGMAYFKERGYKEAVIEKFHLGYSTGKKDAFSLAALKQGYKIGYLIKTGLTIQRGNVNYDRFSGRIIFPIHSLSGRVIGFGGRTLKKEEKAAKYLNSPESEIYHKSRILYGLYFARQAISRNNKCFLVEGYTDVLSLHQSGIENVVASSGTSLTADQIRLVKRFTKNITILFDGDEAGIKASLRGTDLILEEGMNVRVVLFPEGEDPDSFSRKTSSSELLDYLKDNEKDFISFKSQLLLKDAKDDPAKRANLIREIVSSVAIIPENIARSVYIKECSNLLSIEERILYLEVNKIRMNKFRQDRIKESRIEDEVALKPTLPAIPSFVEDIYHESQEKEMIRLLLHYSNNTLFNIKETKDEEKKDISVAEYIINEIQDDELEFKNLIYKKIFEEFRDHLEKGEILTSRYFINHADEEISKLAADLLSTSYGLGKIWRKRENYIETEDMKLKNTIPETLLLYKRKILEIAKKEKHDQLKTAQENKLPYDDIQKIQEEIKIIGSTITKISREKGWVVLK